MLQNSFLFSSSPEHLEDVRSYEQNELSKKKTSWVKKWNTVCNLHSSLSFNPLGKSLSCAGWPVHHRCSAAMVSHPASSFLFPVVPAHAQNAGFVSTLKSGRQKPVPGQPSKKPEHWLSAPISSSQGRNQELGVYSNPLDAEKREG